MLVMVIDERELTVFLGPGFNSKSIRERCIQNLNQRRKNDFIFYLIFMVCGNTTIWQIIMLACNLKSYVYRVYFLNYLSERKSQLLSLNILFYFINIQKTKRVIRLLKQNIVFDIRRDNSFWN